MSTLDVSTADLTTLSNEMKRSGGAVATEITNIKNNLWGTGTHNGQRESGKNYQKQGEEANAALERVAYWLAHWSTAVKSTGSALGQSAIAYSNTDALNAKKVSELS
ncbi:hypothetical protein ACFVMC_01590 [Nocardia sp. NPDC127579]|uniref:hypothetical protein n=1 Tax=Nocardia sp. NPDC127579 TaxID=3345402 RepID=UPI0036289F9D